MQYTIMRARHLKAGRVSDMHKYRLGIEELDASVGGVSGGMSILVSGPPMSMKRAIVHAMAARGMEDGEGVILVLTMETGDSVLSAFGAEKLDTGRLKIIDCMSGPLGLDIKYTMNVEAVSGPMDLTGVGVRVGRLMSEWREMPVRLCIDSLSTLLMYSSLQTVFRFVHLLNGRIRAGGSLGIGVVAEGMHDDRTMATIRQLYGAAVEIKDTEGACYVRAVGLTPRPTPWHEIGPAEVTDDQ